MKKKTAAWKRRRFEGVSCRLAFNDRFRWLASAGMNGVVMLYDVGSSRVRAEMKHNGGVIRMVWHPNQVVLITACLDGCVYLWDGRTGQLLKQLNGHTVGGTVAGHGCRGGQEQNVYLHGVRRQDVPGVPR